MSFTVILLLYSLFKFLFLTHTYLNKLISTSWKPVWWPFHCNKPKLVQFSVRQNVFFCSRADLHLHLVSLKGPQVPFAQVAPEKHSWIVKHPARILMHSDESNCVYTSKSWTCIDDSCMHTNCTEKLCYTMCPGSPTSPGGPWGPAWPLEEWGKEDKSFQRWIRKKTM